MYAGKLFRLPVDPNRYKWVALSNTTLGVLLATLDGSIVLIAMPDIFRGVRLDPLQPGNSFYLLWMILGFLVVSSVLVVSLGRLGDLYGRVRMYNLGFVVYTLSSLLLTIDWMHGHAGADWLIGFRIVQGIGAAFLVANSVAILTDAFPGTSAGSRSGSTTSSGSAACSSGSCSAASWRRSSGGSSSSSPSRAGSQGRSGRTGACASRRPQPRADRLARQPHLRGRPDPRDGGDHVRDPALHGDAMGWRSPFVDGVHRGGAALLAVFAAVEVRSAAPMFRLGLFRIRAFTFGVLSSFLSAVARGGLMFMLIIWLQGIWLPEHGYDFAATPLWAGIRMLPLTVGFLLAGPLSGILSDRSARGRSRPAG